MYVVVHVRSAFNILCLCVVYVLMHNICFVVSLCVQNYILLKGQLIFIGNYHYLLHNIHEECKLVFWLKIN